METIFPTKNTKILHHFLSFLAKQSGLSIDSFILLFPVLICGMAVRSQLRGFWKSFKDKLSQDRPYVTSLGIIWLGLPEL